MMKKIIVIGLLACAPALAIAAGGADVHLDTVRIDLDDKVSLQRGARAFVNYCLSCHSAAYMRYNRMGRDLGLTDEQVKENLLFAGDKVGDLMKTVMTPDNGKRWFGTAPPDLTLVTRSRGAEWFYTYMRGFYLDEKSPSGWNNTVFENVAMPHVLHEWQGSRRVSKVTTDEHTGEKHYDFEWVRKGTMTPDEYDDEIRALTNFMVYLGEPAKLVRGKIGGYVLLFLALFLVLAYLLKKEYWKDIH